MERPVVAPASTTGARCASRAARSGAKVAGLHKGRPCASAACPGGPSVPMAERPRSVRRHWSIGAPWLGIAIGNWPRAWRSHSHGTLRPKPRCGAMATRGVAGVLGPSPGGAGARVWARTTVPAWRTCPPQPEKSPQHWLQRLSPGASVVPLNGLGRRAVCSLFGFSRERAPTTLPCGNQCLRPALTFSSTHRLPNPFCCCPVPPSP